MSRGERDPSVPCPLLSPPPDGGIPPPWVRRSPAGRQQLSLRIKQKHRLKVDAFTSGAADEARTRYLHLGKVALYQMSYSRIFLSSRFWLTASKQDLLYQVMCPLSTLFFLFSQIFPKYRKPTAHTVGFLFLFSFSASQCTQTSSCSPRRGRLSRCLIASCAGMPPYSTAYIASVIGMDTPCCCAR